MIAIKRTFRGIPIHLDGGTFINCKFEKCELIYSATRPVHISGSTFSNCKCRFLGPARLTLDFMRGLYTAGFAGLVEQAFDQIRKPASAAARTRDNPKIFN